MQLLSFCVQFLQLLLIYCCWVQFCTEKLENARRKLLKLGNKHGISVPIAAIIILERNLIGADFDHVLDSHFWAMSAHHAMKKSMLWIVIFVKLHLNTSLLLSLKLTFLLKITTTNLVCLGPCPSGKEGEKVTCPKGKSTCPGWPDGFFFEPCLITNNYLPVQLQNLSGHTQYVGKKNNDCDIVEVAVHLSPDYVFMLGIEMLMVITKLLHGSKYSDIFMRT